MQIRKHEVQSNRGEMGLNKVIFGIKQYIEILEWYLTDEYEEKNELLEFIMHDNKNTQMALHLYHDTKHKNHKMIHDIWTEVAKNVVEDFYQKLSDKLEKGFKIQSEKWIGYRSDENGVYHGLFWLYPEKYKEWWCCPIITFSYRRSKYQLPSLNLAIGWWYDTEEESKQYQQIEQECKEFFKDRVGNNIYKL